MTIVEKAQKVEIKPVSLKLPVPLLARLELYLQLVGWDRSTVVARLLEYALDSDPDFAAAEGREPVRRRRPRAASDGEGQ